MNQQSIKNEIIKALEEARPALLRDGGDVEFVDFNEGVVTLKLKGACVGCPYSSVTLDSIIEEELKKKISAVKKVRAI